MTEIFTNLVGIVKLILSNQMLETATNRWLTGYH